MSATYAYDATGERLSSAIGGQTTYTIRGIGGETLSEYLNSCGSLIWTRDLIYAGGQLLGAAKAVATLPSIAMSASTLSVGEAAGNATATVQLTTPGGGALGCPVTVSYDTTPGTATAGADYTPTQGTVTFPSGTANGATQTVTVPIVNDTLNEDNETFAINLHNPDGATIGAIGTTTVTILDDDPLPAVSISDTRVVGSATSPVTMLFPVTLSVPSGRTVSVGYATSSGTAIAGTDYLSASGTLTFAAGTTSQTIAVTIPAHVVDEPSESLYVTLASPVNTTIARTTARGVILENPTQPPPGPLDFNGDGSPDLVWRDMATGDNALWYLSGTTQIGTTPLLPQGTGGASPLTDQTWQIHAVGDFDGDGHPDLLWQNSVSGDLAVWTFNNQQRLGTYWLTLLSGQHGDPDTSWQVVGAADMDGDGQLDLVWWNQQTAALRLWHLHGLTELDSVDLPFTAGDTNWQIAGVADFDGDGYPDLVWRDDATGGLALWQMRDTERVETLWLSPDSDSDLNWRIVGVADLNADGHPDLVWQDTATGQLAVWWMGGVDGITCTGSAYLTPSSVSDLNWRIVGVR